MRIHINMRTVFSLVIVLFFLLTLNPTTSFAQVNYMYWAENSANKIQRANLDGTNVQDLVVGLSGPEGIAVDVAGGKMYWTDHDTNKIQRANLDGSNIEDLVTGLELPLGIALDVAGGKMYWTEYSRFIQRANLDGTNVEILIATGLMGAEEIALDVAGGKMYWTDDVAQKIRRANLDGSNIEDLVSTTGASSPEGIALDIVGGKMYWADSFQTLRFQGKIQRANLDGSNVENLVNADVPNGIALDVAGGKVYWTDVGSDKIQRANLDGSNVEDLITTGLRHPEGMALGIPQITFSPSQIPDQTFTVGTYASLTLPIATGGTPPYTYTLSPIPVGLQFDVATQLLSGTPTTAISATLTTYTATDATGRTASLTFTITVTDAPTTGITFVPSVIDDLTLSVNTPMELLYLPLAAGGTPPYIYTLDPVPTGLVFDAVIQALSGTPTTVGTTTATYTATDATGTFASLTFTIEVIGDDPGGDALDVNGDGQVNVVDLAIVALFYGTRVPVGIPLPADVNADGVVNLLDLTAVAQGIDAAGGINGISLQELGAALLAGELEVVAGAPMGFRTHALSGEIASRNVAAALSDVKHLATGDVHIRKELAMLSELLALLVEMREIPETMALLPNYPNPFNPETWIPYHLSKAAEVILRIYDMRGVSVRELVLGHQAAGVYRSRGRAAYWDGRNASGEPVASGVYFYTLTAGDFTATRKMLIRK